MPTTRVTRTRIAKPPTVPAARSMKQLESENAKLRKLLAYARREIGTIRALLDREA